MQMKRLREAWRIWIWPCILCILWHMYFGVLLFFFWTIEPMVASDFGGVDYLENMLVFAGVSSALALCYIIMMHDEKVRQVRVRRRTRRAFVFFAAVYAVYTLCTVCDLVEGALDRRISKHRVTSFETRGEFDGQPLN